MILCWKTSKCLNQLGRGEEVDCPICFQPCHFADRQSFELRKGTMSWTVTAYHCHDTLLQLTHSPIQTGLTARRGDRVELLSCSHVRASTWFGGVAEKLRVRNPKLKDKKRWTFDARNVSFGENNLMISVHVFDACPILWTFGCCKFVLSTSNNQDF
jgi:hypothetical protein